MKLVITSDFIRIDTPGLRISLWNQQTDRSSAKVFSAESDQKPGFIKLIRK